jgi:hypothetical protein
MTNAQKFVLAFALLCIAAGCTIYPQHGYNRRGKVITRYTFRVHFPHW